MHTTNHNTHMHTTRVHITHRYCYREVWNQPILHCCLLRQVHRVSWCKGGPNLVSNMILFVPCNLVPKFPPSNLGMRLSCMVSDLQRRQFSVYSMAAVFTFDRVHSNNSTEDQLRHLFNSLNGYVPVYVAHVFFFFVCGVCLF